MKVIPFAASEQKYDNATLPFGACFVNRIIIKDDHTLRCFFGSENPEVRQSQTSYIDFNLESESFDNNIYKVKLKAGTGT